MTHHDVIQKANKAGDGILNNHRYGKIEYTMIKFFVSDKFCLKVLPHNRSPKNIVKMRHCAYAGLNIVINAGGKVKTDAKKCIRMQMKCI